MSLRQCKETYKKEVCEVATHGYTHPFLVGLESVMVMDQIVCDRISLEKMFGTIVTGHAYPYGSHNDKVAKVLKMAGIEYARTIIETKEFDFPEDWMKWNPTCHHDDKELMELADIFLHMDVDREAKIFYLWGHTFEFEKYDNWKVIEDFCEKISNQDDIWYATNSEIFQYYKGYRQLQFSADGKMVYNPTCTDIWVEIDSEIHRVGAGEKNKFYL
jgi:hypothetical protein